MRFHMGDLKSFTRKSRDIICLVQLQRFIKYTSYLRGVKAEKARNDELQVRLQALEARIEALE